MPNIASKPHKMLNNASKTFKKCSKQEKLEKMQRMIKNAIINKIRDFIMNMNILNEYEYIIYFSSQYIHIVIS